MNSFGKVLGIPNLHSRRSLGSFFAGESKNKRGLGTRDMTEGIMNPAGIPSLHSRRSSRPVANVTCP